MANVKKLFVDADVFVALSSEDDLNHNKVKLYAGIAFKEGFNFLTSDPALGEAITIISQRLGVKKAVEFAEDSLAGSLEIIEVNALLRRRALDIFKKQTSKNSRFTDCINMAIMREEGLETIFSFDEHYKKNGFKRFGVDE